MTEPVETARVGSDPVSRSTAPFLPGARRVFELSVGEMLWSRRTVFMALVAASPIGLALVTRLVTEAGVALPRVAGARIDAAGVFGAFIWLLYLRFAVPVLGVFYGTALIADEVDDKTLTYLFTRPLRRGAVLAGKYLAYLACTTSVILPSVTVVYLLLVPVAGIPATLGSLLTDLGLLALGMAAYGALFAYVGAALRRPLVIGLVFVFGCEPVAVALPGYLRQFTVAYHLQSLVPHAIPPDSGVVAILQRVAGEPPAPATSVLVLVAITAVALLLAIRAVETREYVLEQ
jgi:ABC-type transport system involved in multi-copper enzyme maturation permease subunit